MYVIGGYIENSSITNESDRLDEIMNILRQNIKHYKKERYELLENNPVWQSKNLKTTPLTSLIGIKHTTTISNLREENLQAVKFSTEGITAKINDTLNVEHFFSNGDYLLTNVSFHDKIASNAPNHHYIIGEVFIGNQLLCLDTLNVLTQANTTLVICDKNKLVNLYNKQLKKIGYTVSSLYNTPLHVDNIKNNSIVKVNAYYVVK